MKSKLNSNLKIEELFTDSYVDGNVIKFNIYKPNTTLLPSTTRYVLQTPTSDLLVFTGDTEDIRELNLANLPRFFENSQEIYISNKIERKLDRYISKAELIKIDPDHSTAVELCLMFLCNLSSCFYIEGDGSKRLSMKILQDQLCVNERDNTHKNIINLLIKNNIITRSEGYIPKVQSYTYRLTDEFRNKGVKKYKLITHRALGLYRSSYLKKLNAAYSNPIANNLIKVYENIQLPTQEELWAEGLRLCNDGYITKKGKKLTFLNKRSKSAFKNPDDRAFLEEHIELYNRLTNDGTQFLIPSIGDSNSGGRVVDSFTLMPAWIRNLINIKGVKIAEADYTALHPNIVMTIYGGTATFITHQDISEQTNIDLRTIKQEHLSFFNKTWSQMYDSTLFKYYSETQPVMMENIYKDKYSYGHKITSKRLFKAEVDIMTSVIKRLNSEEIYVGYIYDALFFHPSNKRKVLEVMNEEVVKFGVKTIAK
jgi:hypothetical protein